MERLAANCAEVGIIRTMVAEMVTERELQPKAFSVMPLVWSIGSVFGPAFGGLFAKPADQWPGVFGNSKFLKDYPFAFPNIIGSVFFMISLATGILFLKETLHSKRHTRDWGLVLGDRIKEAFMVSPRRRAQRLRRYSIQDAEVSAPLLGTTTTTKTARVSIIETKIHDHKPLPLSAVFSRQSVINLITYTFLALHSVAYDQVLPVFLNYPPVAHTPENTSLPFSFSGGFGLTHARIGTIFAGYGIVSGLIQFLLFPSLCKRFGVLSCFRACVLIFPLVYIVTPYTVLFEDTTTRYTLLCIILVVKSFAVIVGFPCTTILLTNSATSLNILGTLNGFATTFSALGRASGPAMSGVAFTWGVKHNMISLPWWILAFIAVLGAIPAWMIVDTDGPSGASSPADSEDEEDIEVDDEIIIDDSEEDDEINGPEATRTQEDVLIAGSRPANNYGTLGTGKVLTPTT